jgi:polysaccharide biosynthesis protein PslJ
VNAVVAGEREGTLDAQILVQVYVALLLLIPAGLVLHALGASGTLANVFGVVLLVWWVGATLAGHNSAQPAAPVRMVLGLLAITVLLSLAAGVLTGWVRPVTIHQATDGVSTLLPITPTELADKSDLALLRGLISISSWIGIALVLSDGLRSWRQLDRVVTWIIWVAGIVGLVGIIQFVTGENLAVHVHIPGLVANSELSFGATRSDLNRVQATANHPIEFGVVIGAFFPLALHHALYRSRHWRDRVPVALLGLAVPMSVSRTGILVFGVACIVLFAGWKFNRRIWALVIAPVVLVGMRAAFPGLIGTIRSLFTSALYDPSVTGRTSDYGLVLGIYRQHPFLGRGAFTFLPDYYRTLDNQYLMILVELGAVGLAVIVAIFAVAIYAARYARRHARTEEREHFGVAVSACLAGILVSYATFDAWGFSMAAGTTFILVGLAGAAWNLTRAEMLAGDVGSKTRADLAEVR